MLKLMRGDLIIDICKKERYLKYLPSSKHYVEVKKYVANAILSSDNNTVYHIVGTPFNFDDKIESVIPIQITQEELEKIRANNYFLKSKETIDLKKEVDDLKNLVAQQNSLIQQLLAKIS